jgi:hypothetical protein
MSRPTTRTPGGGRLCDTAGPRPGRDGEQAVVSVAEGVTGPNLPERVELVRAALHGADRGRFEQQLDQALDTARSTREWAGRRDVIHTALSSLNSSPPAGARPQVSRGVTLDVPKLEHQS